MARQLTSVNTELQKGKKRSPSIAKDEYYERENTSQQQQHILSRFFSAIERKKEIIDDTLWDRNGFLLVVSIHDVAKREENTGRSMSK